MNVHTLIDIFTQELDAKREGDAVTLPHGTRVTVFLATPGGVLPIGKVDGATVKEHYIVFSSDEGRVFADKEQLLAVRADQEAAKGRESRLGFG